MEDILSKADNFILDYAPISELKSWVHEIYEDLPDKEKKPFDNRSKKSLRDFLLKHPEKTKKILDRFN